MAQAMRPAGIEAHPHEGGESGREDECPAGVGSRPAWILGARYEQRPPVGQQGGEAEEDEHGRAGRDPARCQWSSYRGLAAVATGRRRLRRVLTSQT